MQRNSPLFPSHSRKFLFWKNPGVKPKLLFSGKKSASLMRVLLFAGALAFPSLSYLQAEVRPLQVALAEPLQLVPEETSIIGLRLNIFYGINENVFGIDAGLLNFTNETQGGIALGLGNGSKASVGLQAGVVNYTGDLLGLQAGVINITDNPAGFQFGAFNITDDNYFPMFGLLLNVSDRAYTGQLSLGFNQADGSPFQIAGLMNNSEKYGAWLQIGGAINFADDALFQLAGLFNKSLKASWQTALGLNVSEKSTLQLAGLSNQNGWSSAQITLGWNASERAFLQIAIGANESESAFLQCAGLGNYTDTAALQLSVGVNSADEVDVQLAFLGNHAESVHFQLAFLNHSPAAHLQAGAINLQTRPQEALKETSWQIGLWNRAEKIRGLMFGLLNDADELDGQQIGLLNIARNSALPFTLFYNSAAFADSPDNPDAYRSGLWEAEWTPLQLALYKPGQLFDKTTKVYGMRLGLLYAHNDLVRGLDLGLFQRSTEFWGVGVAVVHVSEEEARGLRLGLANLTFGDFRGVDLGLLSYTEGRLAGVSLGLVAYTDGEVDGLQTGLLWNEGRNFWLPQLSLGLNRSDAGILQIALLGNFYSRDAAESKEGPSVSQPASPASPSLSEARKSLKNYEGPQFALGGNLAQGSVEGQLAGLFNWSEGNVRVGQVSLVANQAHFVPFQIAGIGNVAQDESWVQIAGLFNMVTRDLRRAPLGRGRDPYVQAALFYNLSDDTYFQVSAFNWDSGRNYVQLGGLNMAQKAHLQISGFNFAVELSGFQFGLVNAFFASKDAAAIQAGLINLSADSRAVQLGAWNMNSTQRGISIGIFNFADRLEGLQIGLLNVHRKGRLPVMVGVNF